MELKRILARDTRSATEKAMALYGPDVLIISNNRVEGQTELIVALDVAEATAEELAAEMSLPTESKDASEEQLTTADILTRKTDKSKATANPFSDHLHQALKPEPVTTTKKAPEPVATTEQILT